MDSCELNERCEEEQVAHDEEKVQSSRIGHVGYVVSGLEGGKREDGIITLSSGGLAGLKTYVQR